MARLGIAKAGVCLTVVYVCFIVYSVTRPARLPSINSKRTSPRKVLERRTLYHQIVHHMEYKDRLAELLAEPGPHYVLFVSGSMDGTLEGQPWCGDCYAASPVVRDLIARAGGSLLEVSVGTAEEWHKDTHPVRIDVEAPVNYIPTLYHWTKEGPGARISSVLTADEEADRLKEIVSMFVRETGGARRSAITRSQEILERPGKKCNHC